MAVDGVRVNALNDDEVAQQAQSFLGSIDTPISVERWKSLGPRGAALLQKVMVDGAELPTRRSRAIDGLAMMQWVDATVAVKGLAASETEPPAVRAASVRAISTLMSGLEGDAALSTLLRTANETLVRAAAAEMLSRRTGGCIAVKAQVDSENPRTQPFFSRAMERCGAALEPAP